MSDLRHQHGANAEQQALDYLQAQGLKLVTRNYRCRFGEIDLIMRDQATLVFTEVRFRTRQDYGGAAQSVGYRKQLKLARTALHYLSYVEKNINRICRFDVIALDTGNRDVDWIRNAFEAGGS